MRQAAKRDLNEPEIVKALRDNGCLVFKNNARGFPDLTVLFERKTGNWASILLEVKGLKGQLTKAQLEWWDFYEDHVGQHGPAYIVTGAAQALTIIEIEKEL